MSLDSVIPKWQSRFLWGAVLGVLLVAAGMFATSNPLLGKWYVDPSSEDSTSENEERSPVKGIEFKRGGRFVTFGYGFTIRGAYSLVSSNRVRLENKQVSGTLNGKQFTEKVSLPGAMATKTYRYNRTTDELVEESAWITPFRFTRSPPKK